MAFNFADARLVLAGTLYGEARSCGRPGMEDVAQCVLNRVADGWNTGGITGVCLAYEQFSSWNMGDPNRAKILNAAALGREPAWLLALDVATAALAGTNPDRIEGADSYFARSMRTPPYWAKPPAAASFSDAWHSFWIVRPADQKAPVVSIHATLLTTDDLNAASLSGTLTEGT
jgi:N-acetylmuramoyl-L-alanine amidase